MILSGALRFLVILGVLAGGTAATAVVVALITGNALDRSISIGLYAVGSFCTLSGFALTTRGALRPDARTNAMDAQTGAARGTSGLLIVVGLIVVVFGLVIDPRARVI